MKFSTRTRYGLRFLIRLALSPQDKLLNLNELAREEGLSPGYLEQIVRALKPMGILRSARGATGGYALAYPPNQISLENLIWHLEGNLAPVVCLEPSRNCPRETICPTRDFWHALENNLREFLRGMTLQDLIPSSQGQLTEAQRGSILCGE